VKVIWPKWEVEMANCMIVAQRHLHCTVDEAKKFWFKDGDVISIKINWIRWLTFENVAVRARDDYALDFHIDIEEANAAWVKVWDWGEII
jgi:putative phosphotransacetylase